MTKVEIYGQLLAEAARLFRFYEASHLSKADAFRLNRLEKDEAASIEKAERNRDMAEKIEAALDGVQ